MKLNLIIGIITMLILTACGGGENTQSPAGSSSGSANSSSSGGSSSSSSSSTSSSSSSSNSSSSSSSSSSGVAEILFDSRTDALPADMLECWRKTDVPGNCGPLASGGYEVVSFESFTNGDRKCLAPADDSDELVIKNCSSDTNVALIRLTEKAEYIMRSHVSGQCLVQHGQASNIKLRFSGCNISRRNLDIKVKLDGNGDVLSLRLITQSTMETFHNKCLTAVGDRVTAIPCDENNRSQEFRVVKVPSKYDAEPIFYEMHDLESGVYPKGPIALSRPFEWAWQQRNKLNVCMKVEHPDAQSKEWRETLRRWVTDGIHEYYKTFLHYSDWPYQELPEINFVGWETPFEFEPGEDLAGLETSCPDACRRIVVEQRLRRIAVPADYTECPWQDHTHMDFFAKFKGVDPNYKAAGTGGDWGITLAQGFIRAGINAEPTTVVVHEFGHTNQSPDYYNLPRIDQPLSANGQGFRKPTAFDHARMRHWYRLRRDNFPEPLNLD